MKFVKNLTFKIGLLLIIVEAVLFTALGFIYSFIYINQLQDHLESSIQLPGKLISRGLLDYSSITDGDILREIVGAQILEAYVTGLNGHIFYSMEAQKSGLSIYDISETDSLWKIPENPEVRIYDVVDNGIESKICISPFPGFR